MLGRTRNARTPRQEKGHHGGWGSNRGGEFMVKSLNLSLLLLIKVAIKEFDARK